MHAELKAWLLTLHVLVSRIEGMNGMHHATAVVPYSVLSMVTGYCVMQSRLNHVSFILEARSSLSQIYEPSRSSARSGPHAATLHSSWFWRQSRLRRESPYQLPSFTPTIAHNLHLLIFKPLLGCAAQRGHQGSWASNSCTNRPFIPEPLHGLQVLGWQ